jgi:hypothetical protein
MKTRLSSYHWGLCVVCILMAAFFLFEIILRIYNNDIYKHGEFTRLLLSPLIDLAVVSAMLFWTFTWPRVEFEEEKLYIKRFRKEWEIIPFERLIYLKDLSPFTLSVPKFTFIFILYYETETGHIKKIRWLRRILVWDYAKKTDRFTSLVRIKNPSFTLNI